MQHKGEIVEKAVRASGYPITKLASKMRKSRRWMYLVFENPNVTIDHILEIGTIIHHDFSEEIHELKRKSKEVHEPSFPYNEDEDTIEHWKVKYYDLLEEFNTLLKTHLKSKE